MPVTKSPCPESECDDDSVSLSTILETMVFASGRKQRDADQVKFEEKQGGQKTS
jgi:hypothetical protein